jgi:hypothetical protein
MLRFVPVLIYSLKESIKGNWHGNSLFDSKKNSILYFLELYTTFLELIKICPRGNSLHAFFEAIDLQQEYRIGTYSKKVSQIRPFPVSFLKFFVVLARFSQIFAETQELLTCCFHIFCMHVLYLDSQLAASLFTTDSFN